MVGDIFIPKERRGAVKNWLYLEPGGVNLPNGHFTPSRGRDRKELIRVVDGHE